MKDWSPTLMSAMPTNSRSRTCAACDVTYPLRFWPNMLLATGSDPEGETLEVCPCMHPDGDPLAKRPTFIARGAAMHEDNAASYEQVRTPARLTVERNSRGYNLKVSVEQYPDESDEDLRQRLDAHMRTLERAYPNP